MAKLALEARAKAYVPFSNYRVGACIVTNGGKIFAAANIEFEKTNSLHAEKHVLAVALQELGPALVGNIDAVVIATEEGRYPACGHCRQELMEISPDMKVISVNSKAKVIYRKRLAELYPFPYRSHGRSQANQVI